ncbi:MAG: transporter [Saprospiraceae bacterium]
MKIKIQMNALLFTFLLTLMAASAFSQSEVRHHSVACEMDCNNDATPASVMISHMHHRHELMVSYRFMQMDMKGIASGITSVGSEEVYNDYIMSPDMMKMDMHMLMGMYGISDRFTIMGMVNYNNSSMDMSLFTSDGHHHPGSTTTTTSRVHHMNTSGLGDIDLSGWYSLANHLHSQLFIGTGLSIPTGSIHVKGNSDEFMYPNKNYPYMMQLGSGTFRWLQGLGYVYQNNKLNLGAQVSSRFSLGNNAVGYHIGNEASVNTWVAYQWLNQISSSIRLEGNIKDKIHGADPTLYAYNELSANASNYGGKNMLIGLGTVVNFKKNILFFNRLGLEFSLPVYQDLNGIQMKINKYISFSLNSVL